MTGKEIFAMLISKIKFMPVRSKLWQISLGTILLGSLVSCKTPSISVEQISEKHIGKTVYVTGKVVHLAPFVDNAAYQLEDATSKVWVVTSQANPKLGQQMTIKGRIEYQSLPFAEQELGDLYLVELEHLDSSQSINNND